MEDEFSDILSDKEDGISHQQLIDYVSNQLSEEERHALEVAMARSEMLNDVVEGLEKISNKEDVSKFVGQLNARLKKQLDKKKAQKEKRKIKDIGWLYFTIILILLLALIGFWVIFKHLETQKTKPMLTAPKQTATVVHRDPP